MAGTVARRYAEALFEFAQEKGRLAEIEREFMQVTEVVKNTPGFREWLANRLVPPEAKKEIFARVFTSLVSPPLKNFLLILADRRREVYLEEIHTAFRKLSDQARGVIEVKVKSAVTLSPGQLGALEERLAQITGGTVRVKAEVDPNLLGGLVVRIGNRVVDGSLKTALVKLKENLQGVYFSGEGGKKEL